MYIFKELMSRPHMSYPLPVRLDCRFDYMSGSKSKYFMFQNDYKKKFPSSFSLYKTHYFWCIFAGHKAQDIQWKVQAGHRK